ncbi:dihydrolipoyl dehydrogenase [Candidatus Woesearchaeota archaeon]|nr:MAG: dihydrolipoyl dehydrogenase [Candidatus Woesearchaeota archaeon]
MKKRFDAIVVGAGSGLLISSAAASIRKRVAIVEPGPFGGTCLNRGCIPSKMLIHCADVADTISNSSDFGIVSKITRVNWKRIIDRAYSIIDEDAKNIEQANRKSKNITVFKGVAEFSGPKRLRVGKYELTAPKIFIAAGSRPFVPKIPGLESVPFITSRNALRLERQPKRIAIIGGGYIGCEIAHFFGSLGTKVTIIDRNSLLMKHEDLDISQKLTEIYTTKFNVLLNADVERVSRSKKGIVTHILVGGKQKKIVSDELLVATGRIPNSDLLKVENAGIKTDKRGFIKTDRFLETNVKGIWAIGDIVGRYMFKHSANLEASYAFNNAFAKKARVDYNAMPHASFTSPQIASVGETEEELISRNARYEKTFSRYIDTGYGLAIDDREGFVKALFDPQGRILGCHIIGSQASILIHEVIVAMRAGLKRGDVARTVHIHPALSEVVQRAFGQ